METVSLSNQLDIRKDVNITKQKWLDEVSKHFLWYVDWFAKLVYFNYIKNERTDIWADIETMVWISSEDINDKIIVPYYHYVEKNFKTFWYKATYNQLNTECKVYFKQIKNNFEWYRKFIIKNLNKEIEYKDWKVLLYSPKNGWKTGALILNNLPTIEKISKRLEHWWVKFNDIVSELEWKSLSDKVFLDIKKYNISVRKYYFHKWTEPISDVLEEDLIHFLHKKFKIPTINSVSIPLDSRFFGWVGFDKENLDSIIETQLIQDKSIWNQYYVRIRNLFNKEQSSIKIPVQHNPFVFEQLKNKVHKKFKLNIAKIGLTIEVHSVKITKDAFEYTQNFRVNTNYEVQSALKDKNLIRILGYDLWHTKTLAWTIIEVDWQLYKDYIENLKKTYSWKKFKKKISHEISSASVKKVLAEKNIPEYKIVKKLDFKSKKFNKKVALIQSNIAQAQSFEQDKVVKKLWKQLNWLRKSHTNFILNKLLEQKH